MIRTTLASLQTADTFRWADADDRTPLMVVVDIRPDVVLVERFDADGLPWPVGCNPSAEVVPQSQTI